MEKLQQLDVLKFLEKFLSTNADKAKQACAEEEHGGGLRICYD